MGYYGGTGVIDGRRAKQPHGAGERREPRVLLDYCWIRVGGLGPRGEHLRWTVWFEMYRMSAPRLHLSLARRFRCGSRNDSTPAGIRLRLSPHPGQGGDLPND